MAGIYAGGTNGESPTEVDYRGRAKMPGSEHVRLLAARIDSLQNAPRE